MELILVLVVVGLGLAFYWNQKNKAVKPSAPEAPYKVETPATPVVDTPPTVAKQSVVESQITDAVTQAAPAKKARKTKAAGGASVAKTTKSAKAKKATKSK